MIIWLIIPFCTLPMREPLEILTQNLPELSNTPNKLFNIK